MEGVSTVMPLAISAGRILSTALPLMSGGGEGEGGVSQLAEARAKAAEAQARREAESRLRQARDKADDLREQGEKTRAKARVGAATNGLSLSGTSLLSLENIDTQTGHALDELLGDAERQVSDILAAGAEQARSIRLSGRVARSRDGGTNSLLRLGGQILGERGRGPSAPPTHPSHPPYPAPRPMGW